MSILERLQGAVKDAAREALGAELDEVGLDPVPPGKPGDLCWNAFRVAKDLGKKPPEVTGPVAEALVRSELVGATHVQGGFLNLEIAPGPFLEDVVGTVLASGERYGHAVEPTGRHVLVEFSAPNTNKPQHLGHVRNNLLGMAVTNLLEAVGHRVTRTNLVNDRGIHICKSMLAYERFGDGASPESTGKKGDHLVGELYVRYAQEEKTQADALIAEQHADAQARHDELKARGKEATKEEKQELKRLAKQLGEVPLQTEIARAAQEMLRKWEAGDPKVIALWERMNSWVLEGFHATYASLGIRFDKIYFESQTWERGREVVQKGLEAGVLEREDNGAIGVDLGEWKLGKKILLRGDGTALYMTQDLATTAFKVDDFHPDWQVWVVGDEQRHHFKVLFKVLELLGNEWAKDCHHLAYGMINLPKGKGKMKSREGTTVDADTLLEEVIGLARTEVVLRSPELPPEEVAARARVVALAALKYRILHIGAETTMTYDPGESVKFEGNTGPYLLYSYARVRGIELKVEPAPDANADYGALVHPDEKELGLLLSRFPGAVEAAAASYNPAQLAGMLYDIARAFARFFESCHIKNCEDPNLQLARLELARAVACTLRAGLDILGIETVERM